MKETFPFRYRCKKCQHENIFHLPVGMNPLRFLESDEFVRAVCPNCRKHYVSGGGNKE